MIMKTSNDDKYSKKWAISKENEHCMWCEKNPCESLTYGQKTDEFLEKADKLEFVTVHDRESYVTFELRKMMYGEVQEGICILPVCMTATVMKHFHGDNLINELMGL